MNTSTSASTVPSNAHSSSWRGNTSSPSARNIAICATQASPWWNTVTERFAGYARRAERQTGHVHGEEARPVQRVGAPNATAAVASVATG